MRKIVAFFFLFIFTFQVLPVKAIGKLIAKGTQTEEVKEDGGDDKGLDGKDGKFDDLFFYTPSPFTSVANDPVTTLHLFRNSTDLTDTHVKDIHCPPPNC